MAFKRLKINVQGQSLTHLTNEAWRSIELNNSPPVLYRYGTSLARIINGPDSKPMIETINFNTLRGLVDRTAFWHKIIKNQSAKEGEDKYTEVPVFPSKDVIHNMLGTPWEKLPLLQGIINVPNFAANGALQMVPGYSPDTQYYYSPTFKDELPEIPAKPSYADVCAARDLLLEDLVGDFPFEDKSYDESYILSMLFQPFMRNMIKSFCPFYLIDKPQAGTGASLLAQSIITITTGGKLSAASSMDLTGGEAEIGKKFLATFMQAPQVVFFDNIVGELESKRLTETITSHYYADRVLGMSKMAHFPVRNLWVATGNNPKMSPDMVRRTVRIRLNANMARPEQRTGLKHENLEIWVQENLPKLIHACLLIIQYWVSKGMPLGPIAKGGGFDHWSQVMGGIIGLLEMDKEFLGNSKTMHSHLDDETLSWSLFLQQWWKVHENKSITSSNAFDMLTDLESDIFITHSTNEQSQVIFMGKKLAAMKDKTIGTLTIKSAPSINNGKRWKLEKWDLGD